MECFGSPHLLLPDDTCPDHSHPEDEPLSNSVGVFKEGPDSYVLTFVEVGEKEGRGSTKGPDESYNFNDNLYPTIWPKSDALRKRREDDEADMQVGQMTERPLVSQEIQEMSDHAERIVSYLLKSTEAVRKGLGVCRKVAPRNFYNEAMDNVTSGVIKGIMNCVQNKLEDGLGCTTCITLHPDLQQFLNWLLKGQPGMACCPPRPKTSEKASFLFKQEGFRGINCSSNEADICGVTTKATDVSSEPVKKIIQVAKKGIARPVLQSE